MVPDKCAAAILEEFEFEAVLRVGEAVCVGAGKCVSYTAHIRT